MAKKIKESPYREYDHELDKFVDVDFSDEDGSGGVEVVFEPEEEEGEEDEG